MLEAGQPRAELNTTKQSLGPASATRAVAGAEEARLERLQILASVWKHLSLYHAFVAQDSSVDLDGAFQAAVPAVERATSATEIADALNATLFAAVGDPLSYARTRAQTDNAIGMDPSRAGLVRWLSNDVIYVDARVNRPQTTAFRDSVAAALSDAVATGRPVRRMLVDLRWQSKDAYADASFLGLWLSRPAAMGARVARFHQGIYGNRPWLVYAAQAFDFPPVSATLPRADEVVFLTNLSSYALARRELDVLQAQPGVAVVTERAGLVYDEWDQLHYGDSVRVRIQSPMPVSMLDGALGTRPDTVVEGPVASADLQLVAGAALHRAAQRTGRARFLYPRPWSRSYDVSSNHLTREQRLLGLVQMWTQVGTFGAYLEYATPAWRDRMIPAAWIRLVERTQTPREYHRALQHALAGTNDTHVRLVHPTTAPGRYSLPLFAERFGSHVVITRVDTGSQDATIAVGAELLAVNGLSVNALEDSAAPFIPSSSRPLLARDVWRLSLPLRGEKDSEVRLTLRTAGGERNVTVRRTRLLEGSWMRREADSIAAVPLVQRLAGNIGYVDLNRLRSGAELDSVLNEVRNTAGLILDARSSRPQWADGDIRDHLSARFLDRPISIRSQGTTVSYMLDAAPVTAVEQQPWTRVPWSTALTASKARWMKPLVVLIGPRNQSYGEAILAPLSDARRAIFVGQPTAGTNGEAPDFRIVGGALVIFTHSRVTQADGSRYHGIGIVPQIRVDPTPADIRRGVDVVLEAGRRALIRASRAASTPIPR